MPRRKAEVKSFTFYFRGSIKAKTLEEARNVLLNIVNTKHKQLVGQETSIEMLFHKPVVQKKKGPRGGVKEITTHYVPAREILRENGEFEEVAFDKEEEERVKKKRGRKMVKRKL